LYAKQITHISADGSTPEEQLLSAMYEHLVTSLFERCVAVAGDDLRSRLIYQRRMPPEIAELVRVPVYGGDYRTPSSPHPEQPAPLVSRVFPTPVVFLDTSMQPSPWQRNGDRNETSIVNDLEAAWVRGVCEQWEHELRALNQPSQINVSVLAFYSAQASLIRRKLGHPLYKDFPRLNFKRVDPVDRIQGQQSDLVIISFCRTFPPGPPRRPIRGEGPPPGAGYAQWLQNINRLNVACTRARRSLVLIGHQPTLRRLSGVQTAESFYANLFGQPRHVLTMRTDWVPEQRRRQR
jgi:superfamily I DNA and/or RNA helicase